MAFSGSIQSIDETCLRVFGEDAFFIPQTAGESDEPIAIRGITCPTPLVDVVPVGGDVGVTNIYFFVRFAAITPNPRNGDVIQYGGVPYDIADVLVDRGGGATLKLRKN